LYVLLILNYYFEFFYLQVVIAIPIPLLIIYACPMLKYENDYYILIQTISVAIKRHQSIIDFLFTCVVIFLVAVETLCIGCGLEMEQLVNNFKRPLPLIAVCEDHKFDLY